MGRSVGLLTAWGATWAAGLPGVWILFRNGNPGFLFFSRRADEAFLGSPTTPALADLLYMHAQLEGAIIGGLGIVILALAWWGVRHGMRWPLAALALVLVSLAAFLVAALVQYAARGVTVGIGDVQPFALAGLLLGIPAVGLGWWATRAGAA